MRPTPVYRFWNPKSGPLGGLIFGAILLAVVFALLAVFGCDQLRETPPPTAAAPTAPSIPIPSNLPSDRTVAIEYEITNGGSTEKVAGTGAGMTATGDKVNASDLKSSAPTANLSDGGGAIGGMFSGSMTAQITDNSVKLACIGIGAAGILAGLWLVSRGNRHGLALAGAGGGLVAAGLMPAWFWPIAGVVALGVGVYWLWTTKLAGERKVESETLTRVLSAVDAAPDGVRSTVKQIVEKKADDKHKAVIRRLTK